MMFAQLYCGHECSHLRFVDNVCKLRKCYEHMENEVWWDLLSLEFSDHLIVYDFIRTALLLVFAVANKRKLDDGNKKRFSSWASRANSKACEQTLKEIWTLWIKYSTSEGIDNDVLTHVNGPGLKAVGEAFLATGIHVLFGDNCVSAQYTGPPCTIPGIQKRFLASLSEELGKPTTYA